MTFWQRREGQLFLVGIGLWCIVLGELALWWAYDTTMARNILFGMGAEILTGREGGVPTALALGVPPWVIFHISVLQDLGSALLMYPFFLWALHEYRDRDNHLMRRLRQIEEKAQANRRFVKRWGPLGIALFMLIPFLVNGPMVGLVLGRLAGMKTPQVLPPVVIASIIAAAAWTWFFDAMIGFAGTFDPRAGVYIAVAMVVIVVTLAVVDWWRAGRDPSP